jgi:cytochrome c oxidase cbb3-type subunit III
VTPPVTATATASGDSDVPATSQRSTATGARVLEHSYDGIQEYDNPLPGWWRAIFYASIVFALGYWIWYHAGGPGQSELAEYAAARKAYDDDRANDQASEGSVSDVTLSARAGDATAVEHGRGVFTKYCASCHTDSGKGLVGPNLTDEFQKHGASRADLFKTVSGGIAGTAMIAWGQTLKGDELIDVVAFVSTLRGTNVPDGKAAEGNRVGPFE